MHMLGWGILLPFVGSLVGVLLCGRPNLAAHWTCLPCWLRLGVAIGFHGLSLILFFAGHAWPWGLWAWMLGFILLQFSFPNDAEKRGYHDF